MKYKDIINSIAVQTRKKSLMDIVVIITVMVAKIIWYLYENDKLTEAQARDILGN